MRHAALVVCTLLLLTACNRTSKKENIEPPAELTDGGKVAVTP